MFTYKGITATSKGIKVMDVRRGILPPISLETIESDAIGAFLVDKKYEPMQIEVDVFIKSDTLRQKVREIGGWLHSYKEETLIFDDETDKQYYATLDGDTDLEQISKTGQGTLIFFCADPRAFNIAKTTTALALNANTVINYAGTAEAFPVLKATLNSAATYVSFKNTQPDGTVKQIKIDFSFAVGTTVEVDCNTGSVKINGTDNIQTIDYSVSEIWELFNGANSVNVVSNATALTSASIEYYATWY